MKKITKENKIYVMNQDLISLNLYFREINQIKLFTPEEEKECLKKVVKGDKEAIKELVTKNLRFVITVAKYYQHKNINIGDLINEGNIGLIEAANKYDITSNVKFISYAIWWIRKSIIDYLNMNSRLVRLPLNKIILLDKFNKKLHDYEQSMGRPVDYSEIIGEFSDDLDNEDNDKNLNHKIAEIVNNHNVTSIDEVLNDDDDNSTSLNDFLVDETTIKPTDYEIVEHEKKQEITNLLESIDPRSRYIIVKSFGLDGTTPKTLKELGEDIGLSSEMARNLKLKSLKNLKKIYNKMVV